MGIISGIGTTIMLLNGFPERSKFETLAHIKDEMLGHSPTNDAGLAYDGEAGKKLDVCRFEDIGAQETIAIVGDSHAQAAFIGIAELGEALEKSNKQGFNTFLMTRYGKPLILSEDEFMLQILSEHPDIKKVFLINRGIYFITGTDIQNGKKVPGGKAFGQETFKSELQEFAERIRAMGKEVFIVAENPELNYPMKLAYKRKLAHIEIDKTFTGPSADEVRARQKPYLDALRLLEKDSGIPVISVLDAFCPEKYCIVYDENELPLYYDDDHLSRSGSRFLARKILKPYLKTY